MALPATDNFAGTGDLSASWTEQDAEDAFTRNAGVLRDTGGALGGFAAAAFWNADAFGNDHYSELTLLTGVVGVIVRASGQTSAADSYFAIRDGTSVFVGKCVDGSFTDFDEIVATVANGSRFRLEVEGQTLRVYDDDVQIGSDVTADGSHASGSAGVIADTGDGDVGDDFEADNLAAGGAAQPPRSMHQFRQRAA